MDRTRVCLAMVLALLGSLVFSGVTSAAAPGNDGFASAAQVGSLPFGDDPALAEATLEAGEPGDCQGSPTASVWYSYHAGSTGPVRVALSGEFAPLIQIAVYRADGPGFAGLTELYCTISDQTDMLFSAASGSTYDIQLATTRPDLAAAHLVVSAPAPPPNDDFDQAAGIGSLPYNGAELDLTAAGTQPGEPTDCLAGDRTVWYDFVAPADATLIETYDASAEAQLAVFSGTTLGGLTLLDCGPPSSEQRLMLAVHKGNTYHLRLSLAENPPWSPAYVAQLDVALPPSPTVMFFWSPSSPIPAEDVQFTDASDDLIGIDEWHWRFDDGSTADGPHATHRYLRDGTYPVTLVVGTSDGRTASLTRNVLVKTHDVRIVRFKVPGSVKVGRTFEITLDVVSRRYREQVVVLLYRSGPTGEVEIAAVGGTIPRAGDGRRAQFVFNDRLTVSDAANGTVSYRVVVDLSDEGRDITPANNTATSPPVRVRH